jgi:hypothetical protein
MHRKMVSLGRIAIFFCLLLFLLKKAVPLRTILKSKI